MLLHVLSADDKDSPDVSAVYSLDYYQTGSGLLLEIYREQWKSFEERGLELLRAHALKATTAGVNVDFIQLRGSPSLEICTLANTWQADLIVMGRRGRSGLSELFLGSVSDYVFHHALCSVLTVQSPVSKKTQSLETNQAELVN
jgi:nucleotide-binding universal stress UspA family protein